MYEEKKIKFLLDDQDTVEHYEQKGKNDRVNKPSNNDRLMMALNSLDRVQQVEAITEYQSFSTELKEYLKTFVDNKRIVREEDITEFFGRLRERKRRRLDDPSAGLPHFCRWFDFVLNINPALKFSNFHTFFYSAFVRISSAVLTQHCIFHFGRKAECRQIWNNCESVI